MCVSSDCDVLLVVGCMNILKFLECEWIDVRMFGLLVKGILGVMRELVFLVYVVSFLSSRIFFGCGVFLIGVMLCDSFGVVKSMKLRVRMV